MTTFNVGDRVKITGGLLREFVGITGVVEEGDGEGRPFIKPDKNRPDGHKRSPFHWSAEDVELIEDEPLADWEYELLGHKRISLEVEAYLDPQTRDIEVANKGISAAIDAYLATLPPEEPTEFGHVGIITNEAGEVFDVFHRRDTFCPFFWTSRKDGRWGYSSWANLLLEDETFVPREEN